MTANAAGSGNIGKDSRVRLAVIAAQPVVRVGLRHLLEGRESIVFIGEAGNADDGVTLVVSFQPDVILLDPDTHGLSVPFIGRLAELSRGKILVFTSASDPATHGQAVALGAMGVVQKHHSGDVLARAVERVHAGEIWLERQTTASLVRGLQHRGNGDPETRKIQSLTKRELEVIALIGSGLKNDAVALRLAISQATVRNHLTSILAKLELSDRFELAFYASSHGLVAEPGGVTRLQVPRVRTASPSPTIRIPAGGHRRQQPAVAHDSPTYRMPDR